MSLFITFEGVEGCGKSTQARLLYGRLVKLAVPALLTHEPGVTALGKKIERLLKKKSDTDISPLAELFLFSASRAQHLEEIILPALKNDQIVICDRFADSTTAYQGYGRGINLDTVLAANRMATQGLTPNLTIMLDVPVEKGLSRKNDLKSDRFHTEKLDFHRRVRQGFLKLASESPGRWLVIDGTQSKDKIAVIIWEKVRSLISK